MKKKIICITPLTGKMKEGFNHWSELCYVPNIDKPELKKKLLEEEFEVIFTNPNKQTFLLDAEVLRDTKIKFIGTASTGTNHIDKVWCREQNIQIVSITTDYDVLEKVTSTAEHAFGLMMSLIRNIPSSYDSVKRGEWNWEDFVGRQVNSLTIGIVGYGRLGKMMARYCKAFGAKVIVYDPYVDNIPFDTVNSLRKIFRDCDVVSLHVHVTDETRHMVNEDAMTYYPNRETYLINTSRGEIIDEQAVYECLQSGRLVGYATDVLESEFGRDEDSLLTSVPLNVIITPHIGGMTREARHIAYSAAIAKLKVATDISPYGTNFDLEGRKKTAELITSCVDRLGLQRDLDGLPTATNTIVVGSPDCKELVDLSETIRSQMRVYCCDHTNNKTEQWLENSFREFTYYKEDWFSGVVAPPKKADIIFNRWFLHHCTNSKKREFLQRAGTLVADDGMVVIIDWFIPDYGDPKERMESAEKYYLYQEKYDLAPSKSRRKQRTKDAEKTDYRGGKMTSTRIMEEMIEEAGFTFKKEFLCSSLVDNPELFGQCLYILKPKGSTDDKNNC
jgi:D-3-phosphoglycerate dehydrogenase / 2-oxoglutarate reductase